MTEKLNFNELALWKNYQYLMALTGFGWTVPGILLSQTSFNATEIGVFLLLVWLCIAVITLRVWLKFLKLFELVNRLPLGEWLTFINNEETARWVREMMFRRLKRGGDGWTELMLASYWDSDDRNLLRNYGSSFERLGKLLHEGRMDSRRKVWKGVVFALPAAAAFLVAGGLVAWSGWTDLEWTLTVMRSLIGFVVLYPIFLALFVRNGVGAATLARREIFRELPDDVLAMTWGVQPLGLGAATVIHERCGGDRTLIRVKMAEANVHLKRWGSRDNL